MDLPLIDVIYKWTFKIIVYYVSLRFRKLMNDCGAGGPIGR
jgi:hypothetical protein